MVGHGAMGAATSNKKIPEWMREMLLKKKADEAAAAGMWPNVWSGGCVPSYFPLTHTAKAASSIDDDDPRGGEDAPVVASGPGGRWGSAAEEDEDEEERQEAELRKQVMMCDKSD